MVRIALRKDLKPAQMAWGLRSGILTQKSGLGLLSSGFYLLLFTCSASLPLHLMGVARTSQLLRRWNNCSKRLVAAFLSARHYTKAQVCSLLLAGH